MKARIRQNRLTRHVVSGLGFGLIVYCLFFVTGKPSHSHSQHQPAPELLSSLFLTDEQCRAAFPGLTKSIDDAVAEGPFEVKDTGDTGPLQGRIRDGKIYIINAERRSDLSVEMLNSRTATLHQLHRAIITSPEPIPDTIFTINFKDQPVGASMGYSRPGDPNLRRPSSFLMPHFSFWAWNLAQVGTFDRAGLAIDAVEAEFQSEEAGIRSGSSDGTDAKKGFRGKIPRAVWRGTLWYSSAHQPDLRRNLMRAAATRGWADVLPLNESTALPIEGFCRYKYVLYTEGVAYSGRFQFLQMCGSVLLSPPVLWMQHLTHLVRPVWGEDLLGDVGEGETKKTSKRKKSPGLEARARRSWPVRYPPEEANMVFVSEDWSDLGQVVEWLEGHPDVAEGIARRQRETFVGGGYFSPAAEVCYWRALIRGWSEVARVDESVWGREGKESVRFELFSFANQL